MKKNPTKGATVRHLHSNKTGVIVNTFSGTGNKLFATVNANGISFNIDADELEVITPEKVNPTAKKEVGARVEIASNSVNHECNRGTIKQTFPGNGDVVASVLLDNGITDNYHFKVLEVLTADETEAGQITEDKNEATGDTTAPQIGTASSFMGVNTTVGDTAAVKTPGAQAKKAAAKKTPKKAAKKGKK